MLPRFPAICGLLALAGPVACGPIHTDVDFEPLNDAGATTAKQPEPAAAGAGGVGAGVSGASSAAGSETEVGGNAGAEGFSGASAAGTATGGGTGGEAGGGGSAGTGTTACAALSAWQEQPYTIGERVVSTCKVPYNGACPADETREFECQPPTGTLGLGWCRDRQPGVINGWGEAWLMRAACPAS